MYSGNDGQSNKPMNADELMESASKWIRAQKRVPEVASLSDLCVGGVRVATHVERPAEVKSFPKLETCSNSEEEKERKSDIED